MSPSRRTLVRGLAAVGVGTLAGCAEALDGETGQPAAVADAVATEHDYELVDHEVIPIEEDVDGETVETEFLVTAYEKTVDSEMADDVTAVYAIISTPSVTAGGEELNPLVQKSTAEVMEYVDRLEERNIELGEFRGQSDLPHETLDQTITIEEYEASVDVGVLVFDGTLVTGVIEAEDSILLGLGGYSDELDERSAISALLANTETTDDLDGIEEPAGEEETVRQWDSDEEFPNHIHLRNTAGEQTVSLTVTHEEETVYNETLELEDQTLETVAEVLPGTGSYRVQVEAGMGSHETGFRLEDSSADIGVGLTEEQGLFVSAIAARAADR